MRHEYDDEQINDASRTAANYGSCGELHSNYLRRFLDALPEPDPQDDWQQCSWGDISHTDERVKAEHTSGTIIEGVPDGISDNGVYLVDGNLIPYSPDAKWYRIPAPVQHPDPEEHPVIANVAVHKPGTNSTHRYDYATWDIGEYYDCWSNEGKYYGAWRPSAIVEWSPAKVVEDDPARPEDVGF